MELYSSIVKLAPLMLLKLLASGAFAPSARNSGTRGRIAVDVALVVSVVVGGFVAALVLGDVVPPTAATRWTVVLAGCLSLLLLAVHMLRDIARLYSAHGDRQGVAASTGAPSDSSKGAP